MHYRLLATTRAAQTSLEARRHVFRWLHQNGFVQNPDERWSGGIANWFVIGGRWSGELTRLGRYFGMPQSPDELGYACDAQLVTPHLFERFLAEYMDCPNEDAFVDLEGEPITPALIGRKWLVVVDYHR